MMEIEKDNMGAKRAYNQRKPGGGRKKLKPEFDAGKNLKEQMESAVALYDSEMSLQAIADELGLNPIKVRKLLITAGVYESDVAEKVQDAFEKYLTTPEFYAKVERPKPTPEEGIGVIQNAGGVAVLAHPHQLKLENNALEAMVVRLKAAGLQGIEAYYSRHTPSQTQFYLHLAEKYDLLYTCGSDYHGPVIKPDIALGTGISNNLGICDEKIPERLSAAIAAKCSA